MIIEIILILILCNMSNFISKKRNITQLYIKNEYKSMFIYMIIKNILYYLCYTTFNITTINIIIINYILVKELKLCKNLKIKETIVCFFLK